MDSQSVKKSKSSLRVIVQSNKSNKNANIFDIVLGSVFDVLSDGAFRFALCSVLLKPIICGILIGSYKSLSSTYI